MRLWLEHGFSRLPIAERMLAVEPTLELFTSPHQTPAGAMPLAIPKASPPDRGRAINAVIGEHHIDAFWPQNLAASSLEDLACTLHAAGSPQVIALVDDKSRFMEWLGDDPYRPDQVEVFGALSVEREYEERSRQGRAVCVKPVIGVFGSGYWKFVTDNCGAFLDDPEPREIDIDIWLAATRSAETKRPARRMLVMDWLPGPEISVDLLCWRGVPLSHAARTKLDATHQRIESRHCVVEHARDIARRLELHGIVSMQYRLDAQGNWKMLEVNPRPAGGSIYSEDAGFRIIGDWARLVAGTLDPSEVRQHEASHTVRISQRAVII